ncbi:CHAT domain-containing protein [Streptomyces sp. NPDC001978]|uniref:CHAT domain-containing protein n=1 Tax=Streptomyces sp. NPDC001978 TaxID=3364627 RepID=UPI00369CF91B
MGDDVRADVAARLERFGAGETAAVLGADAARAAMALAARATSGAVGGALDNAALDDLTAAGLLFHHRYSVTSDEARRRDFALAVRLLSPVAAMRPDRVPHRVHLVLDALADGPETAEASPEQSLEAGIDLLFVVQELGGRAALDAALRLLTRAEAAAPAAGRLRVRCLNALGAAHRRRWRTEGDPESLRRAVDCNQAAVEAHQGPDHERAGLLHSLGNAQRDLAAHTLEATAVGAAVDAARQAVRLAPDRAMYLNGLSLALRMRHRLSGDTTALRESADAARRACAALPEDHPDRAAYLNGLGQALLALDRSGGGDAEALTEAVARARECVAATPEDHPDLARHLDNCAAVLEQAAYRGTDPALMAEAVAVSTRAVAATDPSDADRWALTTNLASTLASHHRMGGPPEMLLKAEELAAGAVQHLPDGGPDHAMALNALGRILLTRGGAQARPELLRAGREVLQRVAANPAAASDIRLEAARDSGRAAAEAGDWEAARTWLGKAVELLPMVADRATALRDQERQLARYGALAGDAAACALRCADPEGALALLEHGRGILLARALERNGDLAELRAREPRLADRLEQLRARLSEPGRGAAGADDSRHTVAAEWESTLAEVRDIEGLGDFQRPPDLALVRQSLGTGAAAVINISEYGSHALVVRADGVRTVPLELDPQEVVDLVAVLRTGVARAHDQSSSLAASQLAQESLSEVLRHIWHAVAKPVVDTLPPGPDTGSRETAAPHRLWWCPTGTLSLLPLHAAQDPDAGPEAAVLQRAVSSYTPTLRALVLARRRLPPKPGTAVSSLTVSLPSTPGGDYLPGAARLDAVCSGLPGRRLAADSADRARVVEELPRHQVAAFACHAVADPVRPSHSHLRLADGPLPVAEVLALRLKAAELALLPMCETAQGGVALADEVLHLAAAFHMAGFRHVVGSLWLLADSAAAEAVDRLAGLLHAPHPQDAPGSSTALFLHRAVLAARTEDADAPSLWAPLIHVGP